MPTITDSITTPDGTCPVTLAIPEGDGPWPGIVMYPDAGSRRPVFDEMAEKPRYVKGGKPRLGDGVCFEFCNLLSRPLVTKLLRYPRTIRTFRFFKCVFA